MKKFLLRLHRHIIPRMQTFWYSRWGERSFLALLAVLIGVLAAVTAAILHAWVVKLEEMAIWMQDTPRNWHEYAWYVALLVLPLIGLTLSYLVQRYLGGPRYAKSLSPLILALNRKRTGIPVSEIFTHMLSSGLSVGLGGSAGLEAPSVLTGAAIGANSASFFRIDRRKRGVLLGCGAAAAISAIFDSPIAGVLFAAEVLLPEFRVSALVPMMMSSAVAAVVSKMMIGENQFFLAITDPWRTDAVPYYIILGAVCALIGVFVIKAAYMVSEKLKRRFRNPWSRLWFGGSILCVILFVFPSLRGQGYLYIEKMFQGDIDGLIASSPLLAWLPNQFGVVLTLLGVLIVCKVFASVLTVDAGGDGGIFAPSMFIGAFTGFAFARLVNQLHIASLQEYNFVAVGMCGVFTAVMRAPLTGIFLIAEVTGGYRLLVPLMIVSSVAYFVARLFEPYSIYRKALADSNLLGDDQDQSMLRRLPVRLNVNKNFHPLKVGDPFQKVIDLVANTPDAIFPVLDGEGKLAGVVYLGKIRAVMLNPEVYNCLLVFDIMDEPLGVLSPDDDLARAMAAFDMFQVASLPVCDHHGVFRGWLDKAPIFAKYRTMVRESDNF